MHRTLTSGTVAALVALLLSAALPAQAQASPPEEDPCVLRVAQQTYTANGIRTSTMPTELEAASELTVDFRLEGCGEQQLSLVSYNASAGFALVSQVLHDVDTGVFTQGEGSLTVTVPSCAFHIAFVFGAAIEHFTPPGGTYHGQDRVIAAAMGGVSCGGAIAADVCPAAITAKTHGSGVVVLAWNATADAASHLVYRTDGKGERVLLKELGADATGMADATARGGMAYTYELVATTEAGAQTCASIQVGSVPVFPTSLGAGLAVVAGLAGYATLRRRR